MQSGLPLYPARHCSSPVPLALLFASNFLSESPSPGSEEHTFILIGLLRTTQCSSVTKYLIGWLRSSLHTTLPRHQGLECFWLLLATKADRPGVEVPREGRTVDFEHICKWVSTLDVWEQLAFLNVGGPLAARLRPQYSKVFLFPKMRANIFYLIASAGDLTC